MANIQLQVEFHEEVIKNAENFSELLESVDTAKNGEGTVQE